MQDQRVGLIVLDQKGHGGVAGEQIPSAKNLVSYVLPFSFITTRHLFNQALGEFFEFLKTDDYCPFSSLELPVGHGSVDIRTRTVPKSGKMLISPELSRFPPTVCESSANRLFTFGNPMNSVAELNLYKALGRYGLQLPPQSILLNSLSARISSPLLASK